MAKLITIVASDKSIKELYDLEKKLNSPDLEDWDTFYTKMKKPTQALFG